MLKIEAGEEILYVGDHLYSDVLHSKRTRGWRSAFIMSELPKEMETHQQQRPLRRQIKELRKLHDEFSVLGDLLHAAQINAGEDEDDETTLSIKDKLLALERDDEVIKAKLTSMLKQYHATFHPVWGMMFQAGHQDLRLAYFVSNYACLYTTRRCFDGQRLFLPG